MNSDNSNKRSTDPLARTEIDAPCPPSTHNSSRKKEMLSTKKGKPSGLSIVVHSINRRTSLNKSLENGTQNIGNICSNAGSPTGTVLYRLKGTL
jgi:hypothetical protein